MLDIIKSSQNGSGTAINGRGLAHRRLWPGERIGLAADVAAKQRAFEPSFAQVADLFGVSLAQLRGELKARQANQRRRAELEATQAAEQQAAERLTAQLEAEAVNTSATEIVAVWDAATPEAWEAAVRTIGVAHVREVVARVVA